MDDFTGSTKIRKFDVVYCSHCKKKVSKSTYYNHYSTYFNRVSQTSILWRKVGKGTRLWFPLEEVAVEAEALSVCIGYSDVLQVVDDNYLEPYVLQANDNYHESSSCLEDDQGQVQQWYESESDEVTSVLNIVLLYCLENS